MHRTLGIVVIVALLAVPIVALGLEVEGTVKSIDTVGRVLTLDDGTTISIPDGMALDSLKEGADVKVSYEEKDGKNQAIAVEMK
jgi:hypothetical protein